MAAVEVQVPPGLYEGDTFVVSTADGQEFNVIVPPGCAEGSLLTVAVPPMGGPQPFEVQVPDGLLAGDAFLVAMENGQELEVFVPDGCQGGDIILVDLPAPPSQPPSLPPSQPPSQPVSRRGSAIEDPRDGSFNRARRPSATGEPTSPVNRGPVYNPFGASSNGGASSSGPVKEPNLEPAKKGRGLNLALNIGGGLSLNLAIGHQGKYPNGSSVEVLRNDGEWSLAVVKDYDWRGVTYTVMLPDRRLKYFVEEEDLRKPELETARG